MMKCCERSVPPFFLSLLKNLRRISPFPALFGFLMRFVLTFFFDKRRKHDKVVLIDASKLGEDYKDGNNQRHRLRDFEVDQIVNTFRQQKCVDDFSVVVDFDEIKAKKYSLSAGQYFDVKIEHVDITAKEFKNRVDGYKTKLSEQFKTANKLDKEILGNLDDLEFGK